MVRLTPSNPPGSSGRRPRDTTCGSVTSANPSTSHAGRISSNDRRAIALLRSISSMASALRSLRFWHHPILVQVLFSPNDRRRQAPKRAYRSTKRAEQVAQTRRDILAAAGTLFRARGYSAVSMPLIAREAGVGVETIYRAFGSKAGLFKAVIDAAVAGGLQPGRSPGRSATGHPRDHRGAGPAPSGRALRRDPAGHPPPLRSPAAGALAGAAASDPELDALWREIETSRREGQARFVGMLASRERLKPGMTIEEGRDGLWTLTSLAVYDMLVETLGWSAERYERWLADRLIDLLLG